MAQNGGVRSLRQQTFIQISDRLFKITLSPGFSSRVYICVLATTSRLGGTTIARILALQY